MISGLDGVTGTDAKRLVTPGIAAANGVDPSFEAVFARIAATARDTMKAGEAAAISGVKGDASVQEVVRAMMTAEQQLRAAIAVRDRVVAAYQEVSRMQI
ncbi:MAG: flagellar hook-basal body complex protein FliE [Pseudomonadota bacterium]